MTYTLTDARAEAKQRYEAGETLYGISLAFGVSTTTVRRWLRRLGVTMRRRGPAGLWAKEAGGEQ